MSVVSRRYCLHTVIVPLFGFALRQRFLGGWVGGAEAVVEYSFAKLRTWRFGVLCCFRPGSQSVHCTGGFVARRARGDLEPQALLCEETPSGSDAGEAFVGGARALRKRIAPEAGSPGEGFARVDHKLSESLILTPEASRP